VTAVAGLETVPGSKIKDMAKAFGKKFSSGSSISETASGQKEVIIQGDVSYELPGILVKDFNVRKIYKKFICELEDSLVYI
jgi:translation initiation factor 1 (eIF-1/SUI1)